MLRKRFISFPAFVLCVLPSIALSAELIVDVDGASEHLPVPAGYCAIDRSRPSEELVFQEALRRGSGDTIGIAIDCAQLVAFRGGQPLQGLKHYVLFISVLSDGTPRHVDDAGRAQFIKEGAAAVPNLDTQAIADQMKQHGSAIGVPLAMRSYGLLGQDENGFYTGGISESGGSPAAVVAAVTAAGNRAIGVGFYDMTVTDSTLPDLYAQARVEAAALVAASSNGRPTAMPVSVSSANASPDLGALAPPHPRYRFLAYLSQFDFLEVVVVGGLCALLAAIARAFVRRR